MEPDNAERLLKASDGGIVNVSLKCRVLPGIVGTWDGMNRKPGVDCQVDAGSVFAGNEKIDIVPLKSLSFLGAPGEFDIESGQWLVFDVPFGQCYSWSFGDEVPNSDRWLWHELLHLDARESYERGVYLVAVTTHRRMKFEFLFLRKGQSNGSFTCN